MADGNIDTLRDHLFATLDALRDKEQPMEIERAKAISEVAKTVIATARVEIDYLKAVGGDGEATSPFLESNVKRKPLPDGITGVTRHRIKG